MNLCNLLYISSSDLHDTPVWLVRVFFFRVVGLSKAPRRCLIYCTSERSENIDMGVLLFKFFFFLPCDGWSLSQTYVACIGGFNRRKVIVNVIIKKQKKKQKNSTHHRSVSCCTADHYCTYQWLFFPPFYPDAATHSLCLPPCGCYQHCRGESHCMHAVLYRKYSGKGHRGKSPHILEKLLHSIYT